MSILIKGMKKPKGCKDCPFMSCNTMTDETYCEAYNQEEIILFKNTRKPSWCPLVEVPEPHGRLIDADKAFDEVSGYYDKTELLDMLIDCTTVIEAEGEK